MERRILKPFSLRVRHKQGEGGLSLISRLAFRYGYESIRDFLLKLKIGTSFGHQKDDFNLLSQILGIDEENLLDSSILPHRRASRSLNGVIVDRIYISNYRRICPKCLLQDVEKSDPDERDVDAPFAREMWRLSFIFGCTVHSCALLEKCPACSERLSWDAPSIWRCQCGFDLKYADVDYLDSDEMILLVWFIGQIYPNSKPPKYLLELHDADLMSVVHLMELLGHLHLFGRDATMGRNFRNAIDLKDKLLAGSRALADLPHSFDKFLTEICDKNEGRRLGSRGLYGEAMDKIFRKKRYPVKLIQDVFDNHFNIRNKIFRYQDRSGWLPPQSRNHDRRAQQLTDEETKRLIRITNWDGTGNPRRCDVLERYKGDLIFGKREAADYLGLQRSRFAEIVDLGWIVATWPRYGKGHEYFYRRDCDNLVDEVLSGARTVADCRENYLSLGEALSVTRASCVEILSAVRSRALQEVIRLAGVHGFAAMRLLPTNGFYREVALPLDACGDTEIRRRLYLSSRGLSSAHSEGFITLTVSRKLFYLTSAEIEEFRAKFVSQAEVAAILRKPVSSVRAIAQREGIEPLFHGDQWIFDRATVTHFISASAKIRRR